MPGGVIDNGTRALVMDSVQCGGHGGVESRLGSAVRSDSIHEMLGVRCLCLFDVGQWGRGRKKSAAGVGVMRENGGETNFG